MPAASHDPAGKERGGPLSMTDLLGSVLAGISVLAVIGVAVFLYASESVAVERALLHRDLAARAVTTSCTQVNTALSSKLVLLQGCPHGMFAKLPLEVGPYEICAGRRAGCPGRIELSELEVEDIKANEVTDPVARGGRRYESLLQQDDRSLISVIGVQLPSKTNGKTRIEPADSTFGPLLVLNIGSWTAVELLDAVQEPDTPRSVLIFGLFFACLLMMYSSSLVPIRSAREFWAAPDKWSRAVGSISLLVLLSFLLAGFIATAVAGVAWSRYHFGLAMPLLAVSLTFLSLFEFVRCYISEVEDELDEDAKTN